MEPQVLLPYNKEELIKKFCELPFDKLTPIAIKSNRIYLIDPEEFVILLKHLKMEATGIDYNVITTNEVTIIKDDNSYYSSLH